MATANVVSFHHHLPRNVVERQEKYVNNQYDTRSRTLDVLFLQSSEAAALT